MQSSLGLIGSTITPILVTFVAAKYIWHSAFYLVGIPGLVMLIILSKYMREPRKAAGKEVKNQVSHKVTRKDLAAVYKNRNVLLCTLISCFFMTWLFVFTTFAPIYLTTVAHYSTEEMGLIMAAIGFGAFVWGFVAPSISDKFGRKPTLIIFCLISCLSPLLLAVIHGSLPVMMVLGFITSVGQGCFPLFMAIIPGESLLFHLVASAIALTQFAGEVFGGAIAPSIAGFSADSWGLQAPLWIAFVGALISGFTAIGLKETAPIRIQVPTDSVPAEA